MQLDNIISRRSFLGITTAVIANPLYIRDAAALIGSPATVSIFASDRLGKAAQIADFLATGDNLGALAFYAAPDSPLVNAWKGIGFRKIIFEGTWNPLLVRISVDSQNNYQGVDLSYYEYYLRNYLDTLKVQPAIALGNVPKELSSYPRQDKEAEAHYHAYLPLRMSDWQKFVQDIVRKNLSMGLRGLTYFGAMEADHWDSWRGSGRMNKRQLLVESVQFFIATCVAIKAVDPAAKVGGPSTMSWKNMFPEHTFGLDDWIKEFAHQRLKCQPPVNLDFVSWQDYAWINHRLADGADYISEVLRVAGLNPKTPKIAAAAGGGGWCGPYTGDNQLKPHYYASHIAFNLINEFKDPRRRKFSSAYYFLFTLFDGSNDKFSSPVALTRGNEHKLRLTPMYAAFQMFAPLLDGEIVRTMSSNDLQAMAIRHDNGNKVTAIVNNHTPSAQRVLITFNDTSSSVSNQLTVQYIDAKKSAGVSGLEPPSSIPYQKGVGCVTSELLLTPYATAKVTLDLT